MFDFDPGKLIIIGVVALIVIGPKDLPRVLRQLGQLTGRMSRMAAEFRGQFLEAIREAELEDLKVEAGKLEEIAKIEPPFNPLAEIKASITSALQEGDGAPAIPGHEGSARNAPGLIQTPNGHAEGEGTSVSSIPASPEREGMALLNGKSSALDRSEMQALTEGLTAEINMEASGRRREIEQGRETG
ncbi:MAG TPA: twin-arginine translocase TatA/TatE family subunit [Methylocella sp.]|nr:twin-arginine translocase TatA/TatE family subunit [Methylocella sp.]